MTNLEISKVLKKRKVFEIIKLRVDLAKIAEKYSGTKDDFFNVWFDLLESVGDPLTFDDSRFRKVISSLNKP